MPGLLVTANYLYYFILYRIVQDTLKMDRLENQNIRTCQKSRHNQKSNILVQASRSEEHTSELPVTSRSRMPSSA